MNFYTLERSEQKERSVLTLWSTVTFYLCNYVRQYMGKCDRGMHHVGGNRTQCSQWMMGMLRSRRGVCWSCVGQWPVCSCHYVIEDSAVRDRGMLIRRLRIEHPVDNEIMGVFRGAGGEYADFVGSSDLSCPWCVNFLPLEGLSNQVRLHEKK